MKKSPVVEAEHERMVAKIYESPPQVNIESPGGRIKVKFVDTVEDGVRFAEETIGTTIDLG